MFIKAASWNARAPRFRLALRVTRERADVRGVIGVSVSWLGPGRTCVNGII